MSNGSRGRFSVSEDTDVPTLTRVKTATGGANANTLLVTLHADLSGLADAQAAVEGALVTGGFELVEVVPIREAPYTHAITLRRSGTQYPGEVTLRLPRGSSADLSGRYLSDDVADPSTFPGRTFGLQQLVEGVEGAYEPFADAPAAVLTFVIQ